MSTTARCCTPDSPHVGQIVTGLTGGIAHYVTARPFDEVEHAAPSDIDRPIPFYCEHCGILIARVTREAAADSPALRLLYEGPPPDLHQQPGRAGRAVSDHLLLRPVGTLFNYPVRGIDVALTKRCATCGVGGEFYASPTGSWWSHSQHPDDGHDFAPSSPGQLWEREAERSLNLYAQPQRFAYGHVYDVADILDRTSIGARLLKQQRRNG